jgi:hypothetical protein
MDCFFEKLKSEIESMPQEELDSLLEKIQDESENVDSPSAGEYLKFLEFKHNEKKHKG